MPHINEILFLITPYIRKIKSRLTATSKTFMRIIKYQHSIHFNFEFTLFLIPTFYLSNQSHTHNIYMGVEVCVYTQLSAHVCRFTCSCVHTHLEAIGQCQVTSSIFLTSFLRHSLSVNLEVTIITRLAGQQPQCLHFLMLGLQTCYHTWIFT